MADCFKEYIEAEINLMIADIKEKCRENPHLWEEEALQWIRHNAERFRRQWERGNKTQRLGMNA